MICPHLPPVREVCGRLRLKKPREARQQAIKLAPVQESVCRQGGVYHSTWGVVYYKPSMITKSSLRGVTWIDMESPSQDDVAKIREEFEIHQIVEMSVPSLRPKVD